MWEATSDGEFMWPLGSELDRLLVWPSRLAITQSDAGDVIGYTLTEPVWHGALVIDGGHSLVIEPRATPEEAREAIYQAASERLRGLMAGLLL